MKNEHWLVSVERNGESLVTIESNCLSGKAQFTPEDEVTIRDCARHLLAFIGRGMLLSPVQPSLVDPTGEQEKANR